MAKKKQVYSDAVLKDLLRAGDLVVSDGATFRVEPYEGEVKFNAGWGRDLQKPWLCVGPEGQFSISVVEVTCSDPHELEPHQVEKWWSLQLPTAQVAKPRMGATGVAIRPSLGVLSEDEVGRIGDIYEAAVDFVVTQQRASTGVVQSHFGISNRKADLLMQVMERTGIVTHAHGAATPRTVLWPALPGNNPGQALTQISSVLTPELLNEKKTRLSAIFTTMLVEQRRTEDYLWLGRHLGAKNASHPKYLDAMGLIRDLACHERCVAAGLA